MELSGPEKKSLCFRKLNFLIFQEMALLTSLASIKKISHTSSFSPQIFSLRKFLIFFLKKSQSKKIYCIFTQKSCSYILGHKTFL